MDAANMAASVGSLEDCHTGARYRFHEMNFMPSQKLGRSGRTGELGFQGENPGYVRPVESSISTQQAVSRIQLHPVSSETGRRPEDALAGGLDARVPAGEFESSEVTNRRKRHGCEQI